MDYRPASKFADNYNNILCTFIHEKQHQKDYLNHPNWSIPQFESSAIYVETQSSNWNYTTNEFKLYVIKYWEQYSFSFGMQQPISLNPSLSNYSVSIYHNSKIYHFNIFINK
jgi:hypothetical protein